MIILYIAIVIVYCLIFGEYIHVDFNAKYTIVTIVVYLVSNLVYFRKQRNIVSFEFLFALTFALCCFLTYFIVEAGFGFAFFSFSSNPKSLIKGIALAMIGYHCYLCGLLSFKKEENKTINSSYAAVYEKPAMASLANWACLIIFAIFIASGGMMVLEMYSGNVDIEDANIGTLLYWILAYTVAMYASFSSVKFSKNGTALSNVLKLNKLFLLNSAIIIPFLLLSGYRSSAMQIVIPLIICYSVYVKRISSKMFFMLLTVGMILMIVIGMTRSGGNIESNVPALFYLRDFNPANASLGFFVDEVNSNGITGGSNYIPQTLGIVPFLQSAVGNFVDFNSFALSSSKYYTGTFNTESGLGTNIIGDIYYTFGFVGIIIIMFILGRFCSYLSTQKNKYVFLMYIIFTGNAIFAARVELLYVVRMLAWGCIILFAISALGKKITINKTE